MAANTTDAAEDGDMPADDDAAHDDAVVLRLRCSPSNNQAIMIWIQISPWHGRIDSLSLLACSW